MKNRFYKNLYVTLLSAFLVVGLSFTAQADIVNPVVTPSSTMYTSGGSTVIVFDVIFQTNTVEWLDAVEFNPPAGFTLTHDVPSPIGLGKCPGVFATEEPSSVNMADGIAWANMAAPTGGSQCGPFNDNQVYSFGVMITDNGASIGDISLDVVLYGDGFPNMAGTVVTIPVTLNGPPCIITCPPDIAVPNDAGLCGADVTISAPGTMDCVNMPSGTMGFFPVGTTQVTFTADPGVECTVNVTVNDVESPVINNCNDITVDLDPGECEAIVNFDLGVVDNCGPLAVSLTHNLDRSVVTNSVSCPIANAQFLQVFDLPSEGVPNDFEINNVNLGVFESFGTSSVTVNIYELNGAFIYSNMTLLGSNTQILPVMFNTFYDFPVSATAAAGSIIVVEVVVPPLNFSSFIMGLNNLGFTGDSFLASQICGTTEPSSFASNGFPGETALIAVEGDVAALGETSLGGQQSGDNYPIGDTDLTIIVSDASGNTSSCEFTITVNEYPFPVSSIACNDNVQISLDAQCYAVVGADLVLEGGPYGCYDDFIVDIGYPNGTNQLNPPNQLDNSHVGLTVPVVVTDENGNSCWGQLVVEDKIPVDLECEDINTVCSESTDPGAPLGSRVSVEVEPGIVLDPFITGTTEIDIVVDGQDGAIVTDLNVSLDVSHTWVGDLTAEIESPSGAVSILFLTAGGNCANDDLLVTMDDQAPNSNFDMDLTCDPTPPAIEGSFQPFTPLSVFNGEDLNGTWTVRITDGAFLDGGTINAIELNFGQFGGTVSLPIPDGATYFPSGDNSFTVFNFDPCGPVELTYFDNVQQNDCSNEYSEVITRTWNATDPNGNVSDQCIQTIYVHRNDLSSLQFPLNRDDLALPALRFLTNNNCEETWVLLENGYPSPVSTGEPTGEFCDNHQITFDDTEIDICGPGYKLLREWTVIDWCTGEVINHTQIIKVLDDEAPVVVCPPEFTVSADPYSCGGTVAVPDPLLVLDCSETFYTVGYKVADENGDPLNDQIFYDNVIENPDGSFTIVDLPFGTTWIVYTVYDECGAFTECFTEVTVIDDVPPVAVCDEHTVVTLGIDGRADIYAETFDDGSHDNCGIVLWEARRTSVNCSNQFTSFSDRVVFCCNDLDEEELMVEFRVEDAAGNANTCLVFVDVQDKLPPILEECPPNVTINCRDDYTDLQLTGGPAIFYDNCGHTVDFSDNVSIDQCGEGLVLRTWKATEINGNLMATCVQRISIVDLDPFNINDIFWPQQHIVLTDDENCEYNTDPSVTGEPFIADDVCSLTGVTYEEQEFIIVPDACKKIIRDWSVIDWCRIDHNDPVEGEGYWTFRQVIEIKNTIDPVITTCQDMDFEVFDDGCAGYIDLVAEAEDDCTLPDNLVWTYMIDLDNDGTYDIFGNSFDASGIYNYGTHRIVWSVEDRCGNYVECEHLFTVRDGKAPTPYCLSSITTVVMENSGEVQIWASDFDLNSEDNCTAREDLLFSFSSNVFNNSRTFTCADIPSGVNATIPLEMWVTDEAGNQDFCNIFIDLQDNFNDVCEDMDIGTVLVSGFIQREDEDKIEDVEVFANADIAGFPVSQMTSDNGSYTFLDLLGGISYSLESHKNDDFINGVSTLDLVLIQKHILGLNQLDTPYKIIAADIDNSRSVSAVDLVHLRKMILGVILEYPNGQESWRFVDQSFEFNNPSDPFPFKEYIDVVNAASDVYNQDFIGVKIGDVNYSAVTNSLQNAVVRTNSSLKLNVDEIEFSENDVVRLEFKASDFSDIVGYQFTFEFDQTKLDFVGAETATLETTDANFGFSKLNEGLITSSWNDVEAKDVAEDDVLFTLVFNAKAKGNTINTVDINSLSTKAEAYTSDYTMMDVSLEFRSGKELIEFENFELYQNVPNPFSNRTSVSFNLPNENELELTVYDVTGKLIYKHAGTFAKGFNTIILDKSDLNATGVMYYQIETDSHTATKKMIGLE